MPYVIKSVNKLAKHTDLPVDEDYEAALKKNEQEFGGAERFVRRDTESERMPTVDTTTFRNYQITKMVLIGLIVAGIFTGIGFLYAASSVASTAMAGYLTIIVGLFIVWRLYKFFFDHGLSRAMAAYTDKKLREMYVATYGVDITEVKADIVALAQYTACKLEDRRVNESISKSLREMSTKDIGVDDEDVEVDV
mmetsp:Transcript_22822/g.63453  ORF Transcript_22822/g.63453 Transcript_22822/m.63453 type:complete len:194 (-) Transcript_22822:1982-2563(-)